MTRQMQVDRFLLGSIVLALIVTIGVHLYDEFFFTTVYAAEDGIVEYATAFGLLFCCFAFLSNAVSLKRRSLMLGAACTGFYGLLFFLGTGEEISWGQRIFGWQSGEFFMENNKQLETNLHNLRVGDTNLAKTVFGSGLPTVILLYLVVLPQLFKRVKFVRRIVNKLAIPVPGMRHTVLALLASVVIALMDQGRKWEVYELVFSLLMLSIILMPQNQEHTR